MDRALKAFLIALALAVVVLFILLDSNGLAQEEPQELSPTIFVLDKTYYGGGELRVLGWLWPLGDVPIYWNGLLHPEAFEATVVGWPCYYWKEEADIAWVSAICHRPEQVFLPVLKLYR